MSNLTTRNQVQGCNALYLVLQSFGTSDLPLSIADVHTISGVNKGTVRRILSTHTCFVRVSPGVYRRR